MNSAHLHLMVNHFPVIGMMLAALLLFYAGLLSRSHESIKIAFLFLVLVSLTSIPAYFSGEAAEDILEAQSGISEVLIEEHEEIAFTSFALTQISALIGLISLIMLKKNPSKKIMLVNVNLISIATSIIALGLTAQSGGLINHPEIRGKKGVSNIDKIEKENTSSEGHYENDHSD